MPSSITVGGQSTNLPGVYSEIKSGVKNPPVVTSYSRAVLIDTGRGASNSEVIGVGSTNFTGSDVIPVIDNLVDYRSLIRGGELWDLGEFILNPGGLGSPLNGASAVYLIKSAATTPSTVTLTFSTTGNIVIRTRGEGLATVGNLASGVLTKGYLVKMFSTGSSYYFEFYRSASPGLIAGTNGQYYDGIVPTSGNSLQLLLRSPQFTLVPDVLDWIQNDPVFQSYFAWVSNTVVLPANIVAGDVTDNASKLFAGGTETYNTTHLDTAISKLEDLDFTWILAPDSASTATSANNLKLQYYINTAKYGKFLVVGGAEDGANFTTTGYSTAAATTYNSSKVIVVHGGFKNASRFYPGFQTRSSYIKAALVLGRIAGLEPQVPATFKTLNIDAEVHQLSKTEQEFALNKGILATVNDRELGRIILQGVNTLQTNRFLITPSGDSYSIQIERIKAQLNKEIMINAKIRFFSGEVGPNRNTISEVEIRSWLEAYLRSRTASSLQDNLILNFGQIQVGYDQDIVRVSYGFVCNTEVNKMIFTGFILENV